MCPWYAPRGPVRNPLGTPRAARAGPRDPGAVVRRGLPGRKALPQLLGVLLEVLDQEAVDDRGDAHLAEALVRAGALQRPLVEALQQREHLLDSLVHAPQQLGRLGAALTLDRGDPVRIRLDASERHPTAALDHQLGLLR